MKDGVWLKLVIAAVVLTGALYVFAILPKPILARPAWARIEAVVYQGKDVSSQMEEATVVELLARYRCRLSLAELPVNEMPPATLSISGREGQRPFQLQLWADRGVKTRLDGKPYLVLAPQDLLTQIEGLLQISPP